MTIFEWCKIAQDEYESEFSDNHNYRNWLATIDQSLIDKETLQFIDLILENKIEKPSGSSLGLSSSKWLYLIIKSAISDNKDIRLSGPEIDCEFDGLLFANVTLDRYPLPFRSDDPNPLRPTNVKDNAKNKGGRRPGGTEKERMVWLTPAKDLLKKIEATDLRSRVSYAARLLGLDRGGHKCRIDFFKVLDGKLHRPNLFSDVDTIRWGCVPNTEMKGFGSTLDAVEGHSSLPEAIAKLNQLENVDLKNDTDWEKESWFSSLQSEDFCGIVTQLDCPDQSKPNDITKRFRENADTAIKHACHNINKCPTDCKEGACSAVHIV